MFVFGFTCIEYSTVSAVAIKKRLKKIVMQTLDFVKLTTASQNSANAAGWDLNLQLLQT